MATILRNPDMDGRLRMYTIIALIPTIALTVPYDTLVRRAKLAPGIVPISASALLALIVLKRAKPPKRQVTVVFDALIAAAIMLVLVPWWAWHGFHGGCSWNTNDILGSYATVPMLYNCTVHCFFVVRELSVTCRDTIFPALGFDSSSRCPDCQREFHTPQGPEEASVALPVSEVETRPATSYRD